MPMTRAFPYNSLAVILLAATLLTACSRQASLDAPVRPALYAVSDTTARYDITFVMGKVQQNGLLVTRLHNDEARLVCASPFGLTLFDITLRNNDYTLNHCIEPLRNEKIWTVLADDFRSIFLATHGSVTYDSDGRQLRRTGCGLTRGTIRYDADSHATRIAHKWLKLQIEITPYNPSTPDNHATR